MSYVVSFTGSLVRWSFVYIFPDFLYEDYIKQPPMDYNYIWSDWSSNLQYLKYILLFLSLSFWFCFALSFWTIKENIVSCMVTFSLIIFHELLYYYGISAVLQIYQWLFLALVNLYNLFGSELWRVQ